MTKLNRLQEGRTYETENIHQLLKGEYCSFTAIAGNQQFAGISEEGQSITVLEPIGEPLPVVSSSRRAKWQVTILPETVVSGLRGQGQSQQNQEQRRPMGV